MVDQKELRKQIRVLLKEGLLEEVLTKEVVAAIEKKLAGNIADVLTKIDTRHREVMGYLMRQTGVNATKKD